ncbi:MAG: hypothetical protein ACE141_17085 [Bryobacteraceae bacterium]
MDNSTVRGNATLFDGTLLETTGTASLVNLKDGPRMQLGVTSRGKVHTDRLVLEKGESRLEGSGRYRIEARDLQVLPESPATAARVVLRGSEKVAVEALAGSVRVTTEDGVLLARLESGTALEFEPQAAGATPPVSVTGCLTGNLGTFLLSDETAKVAFELRGRDLSQYAGQRVAITAVTMKEVRPVQGAVQVIQVTGVKRLPGGCPVPAAARPNSPASSAGAAKAGGIGGTTKAVIAGVAIASVAGGTALGLTGREEDTISR